ncbi:DnaJ family domain-containing protein [Thalassotalea agarivorans]|uniref:DnaJ homologue subfamily C member 28 conserved domain-containing protein n=1 Tax=Thalassotalea agarivorans TaxID=349064 RepID=A0A1I0BIP2_THASX|nr:DnaJ family domain-containing protein [Thalassotalea agarivorans]SET06786.1 protein of unknown function [Thalassotalea agarivorans]
MSLLAENVISAWRKQKQTDIELENNAYRGESLSFDDYFRAPKHLRAGYQMLKNAGYVPPAVETMKDIKSLQQELERTTDKQQQNELKKAIRDLRLKQQSMMPGGFSDFCR